jgi:hypothetical protein
MESVKANMTSVEGKRLDKALQQMQTVQSD